MPFNLSEIYKKIEGGDKSVTTNSSLYEKKTEIEKEFQVRS
jgi:hypothetical protein